jgi:hypothetical protein
MKKLLLIPILILALTACNADPSDNYDDELIHAEIDAANYCNTADQCVDVGGKCPFGCYVYVNENETGRISDLISTSKTECLYTCRYCPSVECIENKCTEICEDN